MDINPSREGYWGRSSHKSGRDTKPNRCTNFNTATQEIQKENRHKTSLNVHNSSFTESEDINVNKILDTKIKIPIFKTMSAKEYNKQLNELRR
jgi:hypothetical protein